MKIECKCGEIVKSCPDCAEYWDGLEAENKALRKLIKEHDEKDGAPECYRIMEESTPTKEEQA